MALKPYRTLLKRDQSEYIVNKSRFISTAAPVETEEEALRFLAEIREKYRDASHNCYAYIIGENMGIMRYSDDGEPGGTAGMPIIEVMRARQIVNSCVIVTRYFGGILLGAGGLVRAYSRSAADGIDAAGIGVMHPTARYLMDADYALLDRLLYFLKDKPVLIEDKSFSSVVTVTLLVRTADEENVIGGIVSALDGRVEPMRFEEFYMAWPAE